MNLGEFLLTIVTLTIYVGAGARLTQIVNSDKVFDPVRLRIARREVNENDAAAEATHREQFVIAAQHQRRARRWNTLYEFLGCPWCVGWWVSLAGAAAPVAVLGWSWWTLPAVALAASHVIGLAAPDEVVQAEQ